MKNNLLIYLLTTFLAFSLMNTFAQEEESEEILPFQNTTFEQPGFSIFDNQPIYNSPWEWLHETPQGNTLRWVKMWDANNWYACGYGGTFMKTTDAGTSWFVTKDATGLDDTQGNEIAYDAWFFDMNTGIVVGGYGNCRKTTDGGVTWDSLSYFPTAATAYDVFFVDNSLGFACGTTSMRIYKTTDGGSSWNPIWGDLPSTTCYSVWAWDENNIIMGTSSGNVRKTTDGGTTWTAIYVGQSSTLYGIKFTDAMNGWVSGTGDNPAYTTDGGLTWTLAATSPTASTQYDIDIMTVSPMMSAMPQSLNYWTGSTDGTTKTDTSEVRGANTEDGWFVFDVSGIPDIATIDSIRFYGYVNATYYPYWSATPLPGLNPLTATAADLKTAIEGNSGSGVAYIYANESSSFATGWHDYLMGNTANADLQAALAQDWFAMGMDSRDNSTTYYINFDGWNQANVPYLMVYYTDGSGVQTVYITGDSFDIYSTTDMGTTWTAVPFLDPSQPWTSTYYSTDFMSPNEFVTGGGFGLINSVTPLDGNTCHTNFIKAGTLYDVWADNPLGNVIACGTASGTTTFDQAIYSTDGGETWAVSTMMDSSDLDFNRVSMVSSTTGYTAGEDHRVMKTTDGGATWFRVTDPATSTGDLETCAFIDENNGYVFGASGVGYKTTDGGSTWTPLTTTISGTIYGSSFLDAMTGYMCGSSGALVMTTDGGTTFTTLDPGNTSTLYSIDMVNSNVGYISGSSGRVRRTTDGGVTWDTVDVGYTGVTLYSVSFKDENNGMTGGSVGRTYYTTDAGNTWNFENTSMSTIYHVYVEKASADTAAYAVGTNAYVMRNYHTIVPVELASFSASVNGDEVTLSWITATELNNSGFEIERKSGEEEWTALGFIEGHGTSTETQVYSFVDRGLLTGTYNYRIKQIDFNGSYKYYELSEEINIAAPNSYDLSQNYPNPFNPTTRIKYSVPVDGFVNIAVYNVLGEKVAELINSIQKAGNYEFTFDATNFASGVYLYRMESGNFVSVKKMMILK